MGCRSGFNLERVSKTVPSIVVRSREELQQPVFAALGSLEFPELHDESIPALAFMSHLQKLLTASGIKDFSLKVRIFLVSLGFQ